MKKIIAVILLSLLVLTSCRQVDDDTSSLDNSQPNKGNVSISQGNENVDKLTQSQMIEMHALAHIVDKYYGGSEREMIWEFIVATFDNRLGMIGLIEEYPYTCKAIPAEDFEGELGKKFELTDELLSKIRTWHNYSETDKTYSPVATGVKTKVSPRAMEGYCDIGNYQYKLYFATEEREFLIDVVKDQAEYDFLAEVYYDSLLYNGKEYWDDQEENGNGFSRFLSYKDYGVVVTMECKNGNVKFISAEEYRGRPVNYAEYPIK